MQTNPAVEQSKIIRWSKSPWNQSSRKGKGLWRKGFAEELSLEFRMKYWAREDGGSDSQDGEDDELPCVTGESAGDCMYCTTQHYVILDPIFPTSREK